MGDTWLSCTTRRGVRRLPRTHLNGPHRGTRCTSTGLGLDRCRHCRQVGEATKSKPSLVHDAVLSLADQQWMELERHRKSAEAALPASPGLDRTLNRRGAGVLAALAGPMLACYGTWHRVRAGGLAVPAERPLCGLAVGCPAAAHWLAHMALRWSAGAREAGCVLRDSVDDLVATRRGPGWGAAVAGAWHRTRRVAQAFGLRLSPSQCATWGTLARDRAALRVGAHRWWWRRVVAIGFGSESWPRSANPAVLSGGVVPQCVGVPALAGVPAGVGSHGRPPGGRSLGGRPAGIAHAHESLLSRLGSMRRSSGRSAAMVRLSVAPCVGGRCELFVVAAQESLQSPGEWKCRRCGRRLAHGRSGAQRCPVPLAWDGGGVGRAGVARCVGARPSGDGPSDPPSRTKVRSGWGCARGGSAWCSCPTARGGDCAGSVAPPRPW